MCGGDVVASMHTKIYDGFGGWYISKDSECVFQPDPNTPWGQSPTLMRFENMARKDPDHDWRAHLLLPLREAVYQRQGKNKWVLVKVGQGFA